MNVAVLHRSAIKHSSDCILSINLQLTLNHPSRKYVNSEGLFRNAEHCEALWSIVWSYHDVKNLTGSDWSQAVKLEQYFDWPIPNGSTDPGQCWSEPSQGKFWAGSDA